MDFLLKLILRYYIKKHKESALFHIICKEYEDYSVYESIESRKVIFTSFMDKAIKNIWW